MHFARRISALFVQGRACRRGLNYTEINSDLDPVVHEMRRQEEWNATLAAGLAASRAREEEFDPAVQAEIRKKTYRKPKCTEGLGRRLSGIEQLLLTRISQLNDLGIVQISVPELAGAIGCDDRSIQRCLKRLEASGFLRRRLQPTSNPRRHRPSIIMLLDLGWVKLNRIGPAPRPTAVGVTKMPPPSEIKNNNSCTKDDRSSAVAARSGARATPSAAARTEARSATLERRTTPGLTTGKKEDEQNPAVDSLVRPAEQARVERRQRPRRPDSMQLARLAAARLHPSRAPLTQADSHFEIIDAVRRQRLSLFSPDAWSRAVAAHGRETALLAAALALLRHSDGRGHPIRSAASYLGGMLRLSPGQLNPVPSLLTILAN